MGKKKEVEMVATKKLLANVYGMKIYSDSVYMITGKPDSGAPNGFQELGIAKTPFAGNKSIVPCAYDKFLGVYDTGFFTRSLCYKGWGEEERKKECERRIVNIKNVYEEVSGKDLSQDNFDFWDALTVDNYEGRVFDTNNVNELFDLYISIQSKLLTPREEDGNPMFMDSMYCVEDKTTAVDIKKQRQLDKTNIIFEFMSMIRGTEDQKQQIMDLLMYLDIVTNTGVDPSMVQYSFTNWLERSNTNIDKYKDAYNRFISDNEEDRGAQIIKFHRMIKEMSYAGIIKSSSTGFVFDGEVLGGDYITSATKIVDDKTLLEVKARLLDSYTTMKAKQQRILEENL